MPQVDYEFIELGKGGRAQNVITHVYASASISVGAGATTAGARPIVPPGGDDDWMYVRITPLDGDVRVAWGENPTAAAGNSLRIFQGVTEVISVQVDHLLSFIGVP